MERSTASLGECSVSSEIQATRLSWQDVLTGSWRFPVAFSEADSGFGKSSYGKGKNSQILYGKVLSDVPNLKYSHQGAAVKVKAVRKKLNVLFCGQSVARILWCNPAACAVQTFKKPGGRESVSLQFSTLVSVSASLCPRLLR